MLYVPYRNLKEGMKLARSIRFSTSEESLIAAGQTLSNDILEKLSRFKVIGAYIETPFTEGIEVNELITAEEKEEIAHELKSLYEDFLEERFVSSEMVVSIFDITEKLMGIVFSKNEYLLNVIDIKDYDNYTYSHSIYVGTLSLLTGIKLGLKREELAALTTAGILHDIGKLDVPIEIVSKKGPLTPIERRIMERHPEFAVNRLASAEGVTTDTIDAIFSHHEWFDGTGYPSKLKGDDIPFFGRIIALADVYDALTSARSYRDAWHSNEVIEYMMGCANTHFDFSLLKTFLKVVAVYPVGTMVRLSDDSLAVVVENSDENVLRPTIRMLECGSKTAAQGLKQGDEINLSQSWDFLNITVSGSLNTDNDKNDIDLEKVLNAQIG